MPKLVLLRHGQSEWNLSNRFTGWTDVDLTDRGMAEAEEAGRLLRQTGLGLDVAFTSVLKRAIKTLWLTLDKMDRTWIPVIRSWRLNERHYGALQGLNKQETADEYGLEQVQIWRRGFDVPPPALNPDDPRHPRFDERYRDLDPGDLPLAESLKDTLARVMPYWTQTIMPVIKSGRRVLVAAHGNSLRAIVKHLDNISDGDIAGLNIPTGAPLVYDLADDMSVLDRRYLGDPEAIARAEAEVAAQLQARNK